MARRFEQFEASVNKRIDAANVNRRCEQPQQSQQQHLPPPNRPQLNNPPASNLLLPAMINGHWKTEELSYFWPDMLEDASIKQCN